MNDKVLSTYRGCTTAADCVIASVHTCCTGTLAEGVARSDASKTCSIVQPSCDGVGCAGSTAVTTDDGHSVTSEASVEVTCTGGTCETIVNADASSE